MSAPAPGDDETVALLMQRLSSVLADAEAAKEKVRYLQATVQDLTEEVELRKKALEAFTAPKTYGAEAAAQVAARVAAAPNRDELVPMLRALLEKLTAENERLRRDMKRLALGADVDDADDAAI